MNGGASGNEGHIHIRIQQRNGRKTLTTVQGISEDYDKKKIVRVCKKVSSFFFYSTQRETDIFKKIQTLWCDRAKEHISTIY